MHRGFTLLEVMVAIGVFAVGCVGVLGYLWTSIRQNALTHDRTIALTIAEQQYKELEALAFESLMRKTMRSETLEHPLGRLGSIEKHTTLGQWFQLSTDRVNMNGIHYSSDSSVNRYAIAYLKLDPSTGSIGIDYGNFVRGAIRVVWGTDGTFSCNDLLSSTLTNDNRTLRLSHKNCDYVSIPFAFQWK